MNWKLILQLSLFGFAMGIATVFVIPSNIEPLFWLAIFLICAYVIAARAPGRVFLHGLALGVANGVWMTVFHMLFAARYIANHPQEAAMMASLPLPTHPRVMMLVIGPVIGTCTGVILGLLAIVAARLMPKRAVA